jgi:hypothetical protein
MQNAKASRPACAESPISNRQRFPPNPLCSRAAKCDGGEMRDLENMAAKLLESAHKLPPGSERHELLKQIETFRARIAAIVAKREQLQSAK